MDTLRRLIKEYGLNLLISITLAIVITALTVEKSLINVILIVAGSVAGVFFLDLDYFLQAYWIDPHSDFSKGFKEIHRTGLLLTYISSHKHSIKHRILHNVAFQVILALLAYFVVTARENPFGLSLALSVFCQIFYRMYDEYNKRNTVADWFWILQSPPSHSFLKIYGVVMSLFFFYLLYLLA